MYSNVMKTDVITGDITYMEVEFQTNVLVKTVIKGP